MIFLINSILIILVVMIHYEALRYLSLWVPTIVKKPRLRVLLSLFGALCAHVAEVWLYALAYFSLHNTSFGMLNGAYEGSLLDSAYFSFTTYSSLGIGDISPTGDLRFIVGIEALMGLLLIAWTASFLYLEMSRYWKDDK